MAWYGKIIIEDGMRVDTETGVVLGPFLEPDVFSANSAPLYIYNRSIRFYSLCRRYMSGSCEQVNRVVGAFVKLEEVWNRDKDKYTPRKYFLSQKLLCQQLCAEFEFACSIRKAIHDKKRLGVQLDIYKDLFLSIKGKRWPQECTSEFKPSNTNSVQAPNYPSPVERSQSTQSETQEQLMILARRWLSSLA